LNTKSKKNRVPREFFIRDVLDVAPEILGYKLVQKNQNSITAYSISEVEAYRGEEDLACHARRGKTPRTRVMYETGGVLYVYLIYGMHWMLNIVTGEKNNPQALLIRGLKGVSGPGRLTNALDIDGAFNGLDITSSEKIWVEKNYIENKRVTTYPRIGVDYAGEYYSNIPWRFVLE